MIFIGGASSMMRRAASTPSEREEENEGRRRGFAKHRFAPPEPARLARRAVERRGAPTRPLVLPQPMFGRRVSSWSNNQLTVLPQRRPFPRQSHSGETGPAKSR